MPLKVVTAKAPINIAVIKYWGKSDEKLILPLNDSVSGTLSIDELCTLTSVAIDSRFTRDRIWLNGHEQSIHDNQRLLNCIKQCIVMVLNTLKSNYCCITTVRSKAPNQLSNFYIHICSKNNFPTAAGLASSAAGYACLVFALGTLFGVDDVQQLTTLARMGSGSACRSLYGGFVQWIKGDATTSIAKQIVDHNHWPQMRVLLLVVNDHQKDTSSTMGMQQSVNTSTLMKYRIESIVPKRVEMMIDAIKMRDFNVFAEITMKDSNQFHGICQDTYPPIRYMNDTSWSIVALCHKYNQFYGHNRVAYTFDAGPNACIYLLQESVIEFISLIKMFFPPPNESINPFIKGIEINTEGFELEKKLIDSMGSNLTVHPNALKYVISTKIGVGPKICDDICLLNDEGLPK